jgi:predicted nucleic acid-binding Zn finger protein
LGLPEAAISPELRRNLYGNKNKMIKNAKELISEKIKKLEDRIYYLEIENEGMKDILKEKEETIKKLTLQLKEKQND